MSWMERLDAEDEPRNAGALRTAVLLGAVFEQQANGRWIERTMDVCWRTRAPLARLFLAKHGVGIDHNGSPFTYRPQGEQDVPRSES